MSHSSQEIEAISQTFYESVRDLDDQERLDPNRLDEFKQQHFKPLFPHKKEEQKRRYLCCEACSSSPGRFCCGMSKPGDSDFVKFGLSICLYFKFLKHSSCFFVFMSMLAVLSCVVCYFVAMQNGIDTLEGYSKFLFSTTYGSFSSEHNKCKYSLLTNNIATYSSSFNIRCNAGYINLSGASLSSQSLNSLYNCRNQKKKLSSKTDSPDQYILTSSSNCSATLTECNISMTFKPTIANTSYKTVAYTYECLQSSYKIASINTKSYNYFRFVVAIDLFISFSFLLFLMSESKAEERETEYFKKNQVSLDDYSIMIKGFTTKTAEREFQALLDELNKRNRGDITASIVSFTFPDNQKMYRLYQKKHKAFNQISELIEQFYFRDEQHRRLSFRECHEKVFDRNDEAKAAKYREYSKELSKMVNHILGLQNQRVAIDTESTEKVSCYLVFDQIKRREYIKAMIVESCCSRNQIHVGNKVYQVESAPIPDMILWENRFSWTKIRVFISWILTIVICVGSYLLFGYIQYKQTELNSTYNYNIDCNVLYTSNQLAVVATALLVETNYVTCICKSQSLLDSFSQNSEYCSTWQRQYILYLTVPLLISLGIVVYNVIVSYIFQFMSKLERHKTVIDEQVSYTFKRAFLLIMNMGLIMILLNYNYKNSIDLSQVSFLFLGKFDDFTSDWYESIGAIIILTMIFNIVTPIAEFMITAIKKGIKKCFDTRCRSVPTSRKTKSQYIQYFSDQIFSISERYAYMIATFFITFAFCGVIPILIPISVISFILLYFSDKLLIFKFYQTPINYTQTLHKIFMNVLLVAIIAHFSLTAYFLSQTTIVAANNSISTSTPTISSNTRINNIITTVYIYPYIGLLALVLVFLVLRICCGALTATFQNCCSRGELYQGEGNAMNNRFEFWSLLSQMQVNNLLRVLEYTKDRFMRKIRGFEDLISIIIKGNVGSQQGVLKSAQILDNTVKRLKTVKERHHERSALIDSAQLLGLPSYEYMMKSDKLSRNAMMMKIQKELSNFYSQRQSRGLEQPNNMTSDRLNIQ